MKQQCETAIKSAAGRELTKTELDGIQERISSAVRELSKKDKQNFLRMSPDQRLQAAAKLAKEWMLKDVVRAHEQSILEAARHDNLMASVRSVAPGLKGQMTFVRNELNKVEGKVRAIVHDYMAMLEGFRDADNGKFFGLIHNPAKQFEIVKALWGEPSTPEAAKFAASVKAVMDSLADQFQNAGLTLNKLDDYRTPQLQDPIKVGSVRRDVWIDDHMSWVDKSVFFNMDGTRMSDDEIRQMLSESWETLSTDGANKIADKKKSSTKGSMLVGAAKNAPRRLFYKDAASWKAAMDKYGVSANLYEQLQSHIHSMAKDIAMAQTFGRKAEENFRQALAEAKRNDLLAASGKRAPEKIDALYQHIGRMYDAYTKPLRPGNVRFANAMSNVRAYLSAVQLGAGPLSALPDLAAVKTYADIHRLPQMRMFRRIVMNAIPDAERNDFLHRLGLWHEGFQSAHNRLMEENMSHGWGQFLSDINHKLMMQNSFDRGIKTGFMMTLMDTMGKFTRTHTLDAADGESKLLRGYGVTDEIWQAWQSADLEKGYGADSLLTPFAIHNTDDAKLDPIVESRVMKRSADLKAEIAKRNAQTEREQGWLEKRMEKFNGARDRAYKWLRQFDERRKGWFDAKRDEGTQGVKDWLDKMLGRFDEKRNTANRLLREFDERRQKSIDEANEANDAKAEILKARVEQAEIEHDIAGYLKTEQSQERIQRFLERVEDGANVERQLVQERDHPDRMPDAVVERYQSTPPIGERAKQTIENYGRSVNAAAEALGQRRARADARIKAAEQRVADLQKAHDAEVLRRAGEVEKSFEDMRKGMDAEAQDRLNQVEKRFKELTKQYQKDIQNRANDLGKKFAPILKEIQESTADYQERAARRAEYAKAFQAKIGKVLDEERSKIKSEAAQKLLEVVHGHAQLAVRGASSATLEDRVAFGLTKLEAGTVLGEMWRFALQFKSVPLGVFRSQMQIFNSLDTAGAKGVYAAKTAAYMTLVAALGLQVKSMLNGQDPNNMDPETEEGRTFWIKAAASGGSLGIYGDIIANSQTVYGRDGLATLAGPGFGIVGDIAAFPFSPKGLPGLADQIMGVEPESGKPRNYALDAAQFARRNAVPFANLWYVKGAFNRLIYGQIQEMIEPGTVEKHQRRMEARGMSYWWEPGANGPDRLPDMSRAYSDE